MNYTHCSVTDFADDPGFRSWAKGTDRAAVACRDHRPEPAARPGKPRWLPISQPEKDVNRRVAGPGGRNRTGPAARFR